MSVSPSGRLWAIGDIHGCDTALDLLLPHIGLEPNDTIVVLGDVVDRGPGSRQVIDRLIELSRVCRLILVLGNHEEMMLEAMRFSSVGEPCSIDSWSRVGGLATIISYNGNPADIPREHLHFLGTGVDFWETDEFIFIHANLEPGVVLAEQSIDWLRWTHLTGFEAPLPSGKWVVCGHTPQRSGWPLVLPGWICIDTLAFGPSGWLTALCLNTYETLQANQAGEFRSFTLTH